MDEKEEASKKMGLCFSQECVFQLLFDVFVKMIGFLSCKQPERDWNCESIKIEHIRVFLNGFKGEFQNQW